MDAVDLKNDMQSVKRDLQTITNRAAEPTLIVGPEFKLPQDGWVPFLRLGEYPVRMANAPLQGVQVIDEEAAQAIVQNRGSEDLLLDFDHFSRNPEKGTDAAGWIQDFEVRDRLTLDPETGEQVVERHVYAKIRWSKAGRESVEGGNFRYISPDLAGWEFLGGDRMRPNRVVGGGLTNRTAITGQLPVSNRDTTEETTMDYKQILIGLLNLPATATDDVITNRVTEFKNEVVTNRDALTQVDQLKGTIQEQNEQLVEGDLAKYGHVITNRDAVKQALLKDRPGTLAVLSGIKAPQASSATTDDPSKVVVFNRDTAKEPESKLSDAQKEDSETEARAAVISNRASEIIASQPGTTLPQAYLKAKAELDSKK